MTEAVCEKCLICDEERIIFKDGLCFECYGELSAALKESAKRLLRGRE